MIAYRITAGVLGLSIAAAIIFLVRRDHMHGPYAMWWLFVAVAAGFFGIFPTSLDVAAAFVGVGYPPTLAMVAIIGLLLVKVLIMDIERSRHERMLRRMVQRMAILEAEQYAGKISSPDDADDTGGDASGT